MTKRRASLMLTIALALCLTVRPAASAPPPSVKAQAAILLDATTGQVLYDKNIHARHAPASTTKMMTALLAFESGRLGDRVKVSPQAAATRGSSMYLFAGQALTMEELITGLMMRSGNDAAVAIAEHLAGSVDAFVELMNKRAAAIGAVNTHFRNPHGLSAAGHYSTAFDLAWIARAALANPAFASIVSTKEISIEWQDRRGREKDVNLRNTNKLLWMLEEADGVKTGTTSEAGPCLVASATRGNHKLIAVVLHDHSRWYDSMQLLKYGFDTFDLYDYADRGDVVASLPVEHGLSPSVDAVVADTAALVVKAAEYPLVTVEVDLPEKVKAPVYQGQKIGEIVFFLNEKAIKTVDLVASKDVNERTLIKTLLRQLVDAFRLLSGWGVL